MTSITINDNDLYQKWMNNLRTIIDFYDESIEKMQVFVANCSSASSAVGLMNIGLNTFKSFLIAEHFGTYVLLSTTIFGLFLNFLNIYLPEIPNYYGIPKKLERQKKYLTEVELLLTDIKLKFDLHKINKDEFVDKYKKIIISAPDVDDGNIVSLLK